jgi:hypothetical protein
MKCSGLDCGSAPRYASTHSCQLQHYFFRYRRRYPRANIGLATSQRRAALAYQILGRSQSVQLLELESVVCVRLQYNGTASQSCAEQYLHCIYIRLVVAYHVEIAADGKPLAAPLFYAGETFTSGENKREINICTMGHTKKSIKLLG